MKTFKQTVSTLLVFSFYVGIAWGMYLISRGELPESWRNVVIFGVVVDIILTFVGMTFFLLWIPLLILVENRVKMTGIERRLRNTIDGKSFEDDLATAEKSIPKHNFWDLGPARTALKWIGRALYAAMLVSIAYAGFLKTACLMSLLWMGELFVLLALKQTIRSVVATVKAAKEQPSAAA